MPSILVDSFWQQVRDSPRALAAIVELLQMCPDIGTYDLFVDREMAARTLVLHRSCLGPGSAEGHVPEAWKELLGSESLQQYSMESLSAAASFDQKPHWQGRSMRTV